MDEHLTAGGEMILQMGGVQATEAEDVAAGPLRSACRAVFTVVVGSLAFPRSAVCSCGMITTWMIQL